MWSIFHHQNLIIFSLGICKAKKPKKSLTLILPFLWLKYNPDYEWFYKSRTPTNDKPKCGFERYHSLSFCRLVLYCRMGSAWHYQPYPICHFSDTEHTPRFRPHSAWYIYIPPYPSSENSVWKSIRRRISQARFWEWKRNNICPSSYTPSWEKWRIEGTLK